MTTLTPIKNCTGCQACRLICPARAVSFVADGEGFPVPCINRDICAGCGLCAARCPQNNPLQGNTPLRVYGARLKDDALLFNSASGGVFAGLAEAVLSDNGAVFGCAFDDELVANHICITDTKDIEPLQSSKYVQSDVADTYVRAKELLINTDKTVFYTGTPCQIAGLYACLGEASDNPRLLTADLICHGVPSPLLFKRYIEYCETQTGERLIYCNSRAKDEIGWGLGYKTKTKTKTKTLLAHADDVPYMVGFLNNNTLRECCYTCNYANANRPADITLGDYWGIEWVHPQFFDNRGVSAVLINTPRGERFFSAVKDSFVLIESSLDLITKLQHNLQAPSPRPKLRDAAYRHINDNPRLLFKQPAYKTLPITRIKAIIKRVLPKPVVKFIRNARRK